jgi:hypothetical protein
MKTLKYILGVILGLICLIFIEGLMTLGNAFKFEQYNVFGYFIQTLFVIATICISIIVTEKEINS